MLSAKALAALSLLLFALAVAAPLHLLLLARYPLVMALSFWSVGGVRIDPVDLLLGTLVLALFLRHKPPAEDRRWPYMLPWVALGLLLSVSYLTAPINQDNLEGLHRIGYQLYRYSWKVIIFYPLALLLVNGRVKLQQAIWAIVLAGDLVAFEATLQGYSGLKGTGPFNTGNGLAGALVAPFLLSLIGFVMPKVRYRLFWIASSLLILRGMLFTGSRGGIVAVAAGVAMVAFWLVTRASGRARIARLIPAIAVFGALVLWIRPDLLERPTIRKALSAREGIGASTMQWRMQERWPVFMETIKQHPWLGVGTAVSEELKKEGGAPTSHNGYLALAVAYGLPAAALYVLMAVLAMRNGLILFWRAKDEWESAVGLLMTGALFGVMVHNLAEASLRVAFTRDVFWLVCALSASRALLLKSARRELPSIAPTIPLAQGVGR